MIDIRIKNFIRQSRALRIADEDIARDLLKVGWNIDTVRQAFESKEQQKTAIHIQDLTKSYNPSRNLNVPAIQGINRLDIFEGEFVAVTGQSGSGKSTLLNLIGLIDEPTSGEIWIGEQNTKVLNDRGRTDLRLKTISFIFQFFNLLENYTAIENIIFQCQIQGMSRSTAKKRAIEILEWLNMQEKSHLHPSEMSGGEQQRIAIGRAIAKESQIILADEPTAHLDTKNAENVISLLRDVNIKFGKTIVLVTHEPDYAKLTDRTIVMADGRVIKFDSAAQKKIDWAALSQEFSTPAATKWEETPLRT